MKKTKVWIEAMRLRTLPLALASVGMGTFLAAFDHRFKADVFLLCGITTILLQVLSNLANDYGDSIHGADSHERKGPARAVQSGILTARVMLIAIGITVVLTLVCGIWLLIISLNNNVSFLTFLVLGLLSILAAVTYTMGKKPYGYAGYGDLAVLIFFGIIGVIGTYYLQAGKFRVDNLLPALAFGLLSTGVLNVNNIRDIETDKKAGKNSIPVKLGRKNAVKYHWVLLSGAFMFSILYTIFNYHSYWQLMFLVTIPLFIKNAQAVTNKQKSMELDPYLKQLALSTLLFVVLFGTGLVLS